MLAKTGPIPITRGWVFEPKLDGLRCLVCTHGGRFRAKSRRGWDMTARLPELARVLPPDLQLDGELVAFDENGHPDWHLLGRRVLHGNESIPVAFRSSTFLRSKGYP
jgi:ATP-dependent DNA ligase